MTLPILHICNWCDHSCNVHSVTQSQLTALLSFFYTLSQTQIPPSHRLFFWLITKMVRREENAYYIISLRWAAVWWCRRCASWARVRYNGLSWLWFIAWTSSLRDSGVSGHQIWRQLGSLKLLPADHSVKSTTCRRGGHRQCSAGGAPAVWSTMPQRGMMKIAY